MNNTETVICDLSNCRNLSDLHKAIYDALDFPDYYGNNLDALWVDISHLSKLVSLTMDWKDLQLFFAAA